MKIAELLSKAKSNIGTNGDVLAVEVWLAEIIGKSKEFVFINHDFEIGEELVQKFFWGIEALIKGKPLSQLIGYKEFYGLKFLVNEQVLIPRPESELIVDLAKEFIENKNLIKPRVIDVGTGSGCILLALKSICPEISATGVDISVEALKVAKLNSEKLCLPAEFYESDLLKGVDDNFEIILTNLPYIGTERFNFVAHDVAEFEPAVALFGGNDGLVLYRALFEQLNLKSWKPSLLAGEFGFGQSDLMEEILASYFPGKKWKIIPDLAGIPRVFVIEF